MSGTDKCESGLAALKGSYEEMQKKTFTNARLPPVPPRKRMIRWQQAQINEKNKRERLRKLGRNNRTMTRRV